MNIGETIKKIRREKDMTQEQLAEYLNISTQAVSRWETGSSLPDITLLPAIANIFGVSADVLLGIDIAAKENCINIILFKADEYFHQADFEKGIETLRAGLKEYPNSYKLMSQLMVFISEDRAGTKDEALQITNEKISLGEKILAECTDDAWRHIAVASLCQAYCVPEIGKTDKAIELASKMPTITRNMLFEWIYTGDKKFRRQQQNMLNNFSAVIISMGGCSDGILQEDEKREEYGGYTPEESIIICKKSIALLEIMFEDGNYGFLRHGMAFSYLGMAASYVKLNDYSNAIESLRLASQYAIAYDTESEPSKKYTSLLFKDTENIYHFLTEHNLSKHFSEKLNHAAFDAIRESGEFIEIASTVSKHAGERS